MRLDRRTFLQQAALALVSVGVSETGINLLSKNSRFAGLLKPYVETLAQTTNRKLALLIGINEYSEKARLQGCINDVELQKELLIHRFGFKPQDIRVLTDRQATRENIENAFVEHLREQTSDRDVILFHFSGYGSQVKLDEDNQINSLVPVDGIIATKSNPVANDLLQDTLTALLRSLKTDNLITVLDTSFKNTTEVLQGNYRIRSYTESGQRPSPEELAFQEQLQRKNGGKGIGSYFSSSDNPGMLLSAAEQNQLALEGTWDNFSAGLLTYALTRYLWQTTPQATIQIALEQAVNSVSSWSKKQQQPKITGKIKSDLSDKRLASGDGFVTGVDSKGIFDLELTALPFALLDDYGEESCFTVVESPTTSLLQLRSREGVSAKAQLIDRKKSNNSLDKQDLIGQTVREAIRILPRNLGLSVALDNHLEKVERVDATSAFANVSSIKTSAIAGESYADCLLGKIPVMVEKPADKDAQKSESPSHSYGLYTPEGELISNTPGEANEVVKLAINRLRPHFDRLLAVKWLELTVNEHSSNIPVTATLELADKNTTLQKKTALRALDNPDLNYKIPSLEANSEIRLKIDNQSDRDLYGMILSVDLAQIMAIYSPLASAMTEKADLTDSFKIPAGDRQIIPSNDSWQWKTLQPADVAKIYLILATKPFNKTLNLITEQLANKSSDRPITNLSNPLEIAKAILTDLHQSSDVASEILSPNSDVYTLDVDNWISFQFNYDVVRS